MHTFRGNYSSCTVKIYVTSVEERRKKERGGQNRMKLSLTQKVVHFWVWPPLKAKVLFGRVFLISPGFGPNSGFWCRVFLTLRKTLMCGTIGNRLGNKWELKEHIRSIIGNLGNLVGEEDGNIKIQNKSPSTPPPNLQSCSHYVPTPQLSKKKIGPSSVQVEPSHWLHETFIPKLF